MFAVVSSEKHQRQDAISNAGLEHFQSAYPKQSITKTDIFYYILRFITLPRI
jgi:hypothetical protein